MTVLPELERALTGAVERASNGASRRPRRRRAKPAVLLGVVAAMASATAVAAATGALPGAFAPQAERALPLLDGSGSRTLAHYRGQTLVVTFFASWCSPCREQAHVVERAGVALRAAGAGTALLINFEDAPEFASAFVAHEGLDLPVLRDDDGSVADAYGVDAIPYTFVVDPAGRVVAVSRGLQGDAALQADIAKATG